ncbi:MAG TPA: hypothetical protein VFA51_05500 [Candidatus Udaeobacter sp.]|nr:hypothetical protein [Candidatus Udaeobacter sp.]
MSTRNNDGFYRQVFTLLEVRRLEKETVRLVGATAVGKHVGIESNCLTAEPVRLV